ncbi:MAG: SDR family oxidoreductase [Pseudomonadota bacterium]
MSMRRVALVTGRARGIGPAVAINLAEDHDVAITWRTTTPAVLPDNILTLQADLTEERVPATVVDTVVEHYGRLDVIVNNAGVVESSGLDDFDSKALTRMLHINVLAAQSLLVAASPHLGPGSAIVSISSMNAVLPPRGAALYGASKAALNLWTRAMAKEMGKRQIRVNAVAPGAVSIPEEPRSDELIRLFADETALGRIASPDDIARAVRFLVGDDASFITGEILTVSGGYRL